MTSSRRRDRGHQARDDLHQMPPPTVAVEVPREVVARRNTSAKGSSAHVHHLRVSGDTSKRPCFRYAQVVRPPAFIPNAGLIHLGRAAIAAPAPLGRGGLCAEPQTPHVRESRARRDLTAMRATTPRTPASAANCGYPSSSRPGRHIKLGSWTWKEQLARLLTYMKFRDRPFGSDLLRQIRGRARRPRL